MNCRVPLLGSLHEDEIPGYSYNATEEKPMVWDWESWFFPQTFANLRMLNEQSNSKVNFTGLFQERRCLETATDSWVLAPTGLPLLGQLCSKRSACRRK